MNIWLETGLIAIVAFVFLFFYTKLCVSLLIYIATRKNQLMKGIGGVIAFLVFSGLFAGLTFYMNNIAQDYPSQKDETGYIIFMMACFLFSVFPVFYILRVKMRDLQSHGYFTNE